MLNNFLPPRKLIAFRKQLEARLERKRRVQEMSTPKENKSLIAKIKNSLH